MRNSVRCAVCVSGLAALAMLAPALCRADEQADLRAIIDKGIKALGGEKKLTELPAQMSKETGTYYGMGDGLPYTASTAMHSPKRSRMDITNFFLMVVDGESGWVEAMGNVMDIGKEQLEEAQRGLYADWVMTLVPLKDKEFKLSSAGDTTVDERPAVGVVVSRKDQRDIKLFFDKESHLLVRAEFRAKADELGGQEVTQEYLLSNYEPAEGILVPRKVTIKRDGKLFVESTITEAQRLEKLDDSLFKKP